jgi:hypothetical protein
LIEILEEKEDTTLNVCEPQEKNLEVVTITTYDIEDRSSRYPPAVASDVRDHGKIEDIVCESAVNKVEPIAKTEGRISVITRELMDNVLSGEQLVPDKYDTEKNMHEAPNSVVTIDSSFTNTQCVSEKWLLKIEGDATQPLVVKESLQDDPMNDVTGEHVINDKLSDNAQLFQEDLGQNTANPEEFGDDKSDTDVRPLLRNM